MKMQILKTMTQNTQFETIVLIWEARYEGGVKASNLSSTEENLIMVSNYHLTRDKIRKKDYTILRIYNYDDLDCYALNMAQKLQKSKPKTFKKSLKTKDSKNG